MAASEALQIFPSIETLNDSTKGRPKSSLKNIKKIYHCPVETCKYFKKEFYFEKIKFLKQHFVKVHKPKSFLCSKCGKNFPLEATLNRHKLMCGVTYRCHCNAEYPAYEALLTHVKRKHQGSTLKYKDMMECLKAHSTAQDFQKQFDNTVKVKAIIVEDLSREKFVYVKQKRLNNASKETQTGMKMCKKILPNVTSETEILPRRTVSLQTSSENTNRRRKRSRIYELKTVADLSGRNVISSGTQTSPLKEISLRTSKETQSGIAQTKGFDDMFDSSSSFSQTFYLNMMFPEDPTLGSVLEEGTCTTGTQTNEGQVLNSESDLVMCSDSETQTVFEDIFDNSCIDTYTQTCDTLFSDLDFVDIQTQTSWSIFDEELSHN